MGREIRTAFGTLTLFIEISFFPFPGGGLFFTLCMVLASGWSYEMKRADKRDLYKIYRLHCMGGAFLGGGKGGA